MKILKIVLISLLAFMIALTAAIIIFVKTFDVNRYKPQIIAQAKAALNRDIDFDKAQLDISFTQGINVKISNLAVSDNPSFAQKEFLRVKEISVSLDVVSFILRKKINIPGIRIDSPRVTIIRQKDNSINVASFGKVADAAASPQKQPSASQPQPPPPFALPVVSVSSLTLTNGAVTYIDHTFEPAMSVDVSDVYVELKNISLTDPFSFCIEAAVLASKKNVRIDGNVRLNLSKNEITVSNVTCAADIANIIMAKIPIAFPMAEGVVFPEYLKGLVTVKVDTITAGPQGLGALNAAIALSNGSVKLKEFLSPIHNIDANVSLTQTAISMDKASLAIGGGVINASGSLKDYAQAQGYSMAADIRNLSLQDMLVQDKAPVKVEGILSGPVNVTGQGFTPELLQSNLSGTADIFVAKAKLTDLNVLRAVLDKISIIPGLSQTIEAGLPEALKKKLTQKDTVFSDIKLPLTVDNGRVIVKDAVIASEEFIFKGRIESGFDAAYSLEGVFLVTQDLSSAMVAAVSQLQYLLNEEKQIYIPLKVSGTAGQVTFNADADYIGKKLLENQAKQQIFKALDKALGSSGSGSGADAGTSEPSAVKDTVNNIIGNIFKK